jgi:hypothetical protein
MSPYREPSKPAETDRFLSLPVLRSRRTILGWCLWFLVVWFLFFVLAGIVEPLATGRSWWKLPLCLLVWPLFPWVVTRVARLETVLIGAQTLRRVGLFREKSVAWSAVTGVRRFSRRVKNRDVPLIGVQTADGELLIAELTIDDPKALLDWALEAATAGRAHEIADRVRAEGQPAKRSRWYAPHVAVAVALSVFFGSYLYKDARRREDERTLRAAEQLPLLERIAVLEPVLADSSRSMSARCRAATGLKFARAHAGDAAGAFDVCSQTLDLDCAYRPPNMCSPFGALRDAGAALERGEPEQALSLLEGWTHQGQARGAVEVPALVALGRVDAAREASERCLRAADDTDPAASALVARCRLSP